MIDKELPNEADKEIVVLIADDISANIELLGSILSQEGFSIGVAMNGNQAVAAATEDPPDIILMDISMPEMNGYTACRLLKENPLTAKIPVIFITAHADESEIVEGFDSGGVDYITKPFKPRELISRIRTHIELKKAREKIESQNVELLQLNATKDKFFSIISHDLRNPIGAFHGITELFLHKNFNLNEKEKKEYIGMMHSSSLKLVTLLESLLLWANSQTGRVKFDPAKEYIAPVVKIVIDNLQTNVIQKNLIITIDIDKELTACFDVNMLSTVLRNLISNAIKFTPAGGEIKIAAFKQGNYTEFSVSDNGIGLKSDDIAKLFRIEVHYTTEGTGGETGSGLGLILCREFVERHGGKIWAESKPGEGSVFRFNIRNDVTMIK